MTIKQTMFIKKYLEIGNGTQAALDVYETKGANVASSIAYENLRKPEIRAEISRYLSSKNASLETVIFTLADIAQNGPPTQKLEANILCLKLHGVL